MRLLNSILAYGASLIMTVLLVIIYPLFLMGTLMYTVYSFTTGYLGASKDLLLDILEVD